MYQVTRKYVPPAGSVDAPGEHYTLKRTEPDRHVSPTAYRFYSFYRTPKGSEVAGEMGYGTGPYYRLASDGDIFRALKEAVEKYDQGRNPVNVPIPDI
jgi:hypothetical protein